MLVSWGRVDDVSWRHPKFVEAGTLARGLFFASISWSGEHLTDGRIPKNAVPLLAPDLALKPRLLMAAVKALVEQRLWEDAGNAYQVHDYRDYNESAESIKARRQAKEERREARAHAGDAPAPAIVTPARDAGARNGSHAPASSPVTRVPGVPDTEENHLALASEVARTREEFMDEDPGEFYDVEQHPEDESQDRPSAAPDQPDGADAKKTKKTRQTEADAEFIEALVGEFAPRLGGDAGARLSIDRALNHKAIDRARDKHQYLRNWLRTDAERRAQAVQPTANGYHQATATDRWAKEKANLQKGEVV